MVVRTRVFLTAAILMSSALACGPGESGDDTSSAVGTPSSGADGAGVTTRAAPVNIPLDASQLPPADACPADGLWHPCAVEKRLEQSGLAPKLVDEDSGRVREPALSVRGSAYTVGRGELALFYYPDRAARERDQAKLDTGELVTWPRDPSRRGMRTLIASENLLALLESSSSTQRERIHNAITAGPPQRPSP
jgi:hypothetical protein